MRPSRFGRMSYTTTNVTTSAITTTPATGIIYRIRRCSQGPPQTEPRSVHKRQQIVEHPFHDTRTIDYRWIRSLRVARVGGALASPTTTSNVARVAERDETVSYGRVCGESGQPRQSRAIIVQSSCNRCRAIVTEIQGLLKVASGHEWTAWELPVYLVFSMFLLVGAEGLEPPTTAL
jgi:hypothetical protein